MATQTEHLGLHQWEPGDPFRRTDFNEDFAKIDAGVKSLNTKTVTKGNFIIATGSYVGTGTYGAEHPNALDFARSVGKPPLLVIVGEQPGSYTLVAVRGMDMAKTHHEDAIATKSKVTITWTTTGLKWFNALYPQYQMNVSGTTYHYIALF